MSSATVVTVADVESLDFGKSDGLLPVTLFESVFVNNVEGYVILR